MLHELSLCPFFCTSEGLGPGATDFLSTEMIGTNQFKAALELWNNASYDLVGHVGYIHQFVDMQNVEVDLTYSGTGQNETTCLGALGDAFAAGTTDGPGAFNFQQGTNDSNPNGFWNIIAGFLSEPTPEQKKCQYPKPILFNTGGITFPCPWTASILPLQIVNWGQLYIIAVPGEFTTMSGRRYLPFCLVFLLALFSHPTLLPLVLQTSKHGDQCFGGKWRSKPNCGDCWIVQLLLSLYHNYRRIP